MKTYAAKPNSNIKIMLIVGIILLAGILLIDHSVITDRWWLIILLLIGFYIPFYATRNSQYEINEEYLSYQSGITKGKLYIPKITMIQKGKTVGTMGGKAALTSKDGMVIHYNKYSQLYIAPLNPDALINDILSIKPDILVTG